MTNHSFFEFEDQIGKILSAFKIDTQELSVISKYLKYCELKKGEAFCEAGKICSKLGILIDGLLVAKFDTDKGKLNVSRFFYSPSNMIVTSFKSFKFRIVSDEAIVAMERSKLLYVSFRDLEQLFTLVPAVNKIVRHFAEESYIKALERIHDLQVLNNRERIEKFYHTSKELFNRVSKIYLASYLRVNRNDLTNTIKQTNNTKFENSARFNAPAQK